MRAAESDRLQQFPFKEQKLSYRTPNTILSANSQLHTLQRLFLAAVSQSRAIYYQQLPPQTPTHAIHLVVFESDGGRKVVVYTGSGVIVVTLTLGGTV
jgi:hypothetical protein